MNPTRGAHPAPTVRRRGPGVVLRSCLVVCLVLVVGAVLVVPTLLPVLSDQRLVVVDGRSMEPTYARGDVLVVGRAPDDALTPGKIVVVGGATPAYTHRVVAVDDGVATLRGDANTVDDPMPVTADDLYGVPSAHLGGWRGDVVRLATSTPGRMVLGLLLVGLVLLPRRRARVSPAASAGSA